MKQNEALVFLVNGIGVSPAATGLIHPGWVMGTMTASVTIVFLNVPWGRGEPSANTIRSVGPPLRGAPDVA